MQIFSIHFSKEPHEIPNDRFSHLVLGIVTRCRLGGPEDRQIHWPDWEIEDSKTL